jgi:hypothetical protein
MGLLGLETEYSCFLYPLGRNERLMMGGPVGFEPITAQPETGVQESPVVLAGSVQVLHQTEQPSTVKITQLGFDAAPGGGGLSVFVIRGRRPCRASAVAEGGVVGGYRKPAGESRRTRIAVIAILVAGMA